MAFETLTARQFPTSKKRRPHTLSNVVRFSIRKIGGARITLSNDVFQQIGAPKNVSLSLGTGADAGKIRLSPKPDADSATHSTYTVGLSKSHALTVGVSRLGLKATASPTRDVPFEIKNGSLIIELPSDIAEAA